MSGESAAGIIYAAYGANDAKTVCRTISEWVSGELEKLNAAHIGVHTDPKIRLKQLIQRMNSQIDKVGIIFNGQELTRAEVEEIRPKLPACLNPTTTTYSATANTRAKAVELTLEVSE
jgi:hypothetical protein